MIIYLKNYLLNHIWTDKALFGVICRTKNICRSLSMSVTFRVVFTSLIHSYIMWRSFNLIHNLILIYAKCIYIVNQMRKCVCLPRVLCASDIYFIILNHCCRWYVGEFRNLINDNLSTMLLASSIRGVRVVRDMTNRRAIFGSFRVSGYKRDYLNSSILYAQRVPHNY